LEFVSLGDTLDLALSPHRALTVVGGL